MIKTYLDNFIMPSSSSLFTSNKSVIFLDLAEFKLFLVGRSLVLLCFFFKPTDHNSGAVDYADIKTSSLEIRAPSVTGSTGVG